MFTVEVKGGLVQKLVTSGNLSTLQSDITVAIAATYSALKRKDADVAKQFLGGFKTFFADDECDKIFDGYADINRDGLEVCTISESKPEKKERKLDNIPVKELKRIEQTLEELAEALGIDVDGD